MKKIFFIIALLAGCMIGAAAQLTSFQNEWVDYNKTYYRFRIGATGVYRITQTKLAELGIHQADAAHFQLWRNGQEIPIYTSVSSGVLPSNGFIEFWGEINDGKWEQRMYLQPRFQINDRWSVFTDTASYFLTVNTTGSNRRLVHSETAASSSLPEERFFLHKASVHYADLYNEGFAGVVGLNVYSSSFDEGEGFTSGDIRPGSPLNSVQSNLFVAMDGPAARLKFSAAGRSLNTRSMSVTLNGTLMAERTMNYFASVIDSSVLNIPLSLLSSNAATISFRNQSTVSTDRMVVGMYELTYPRQFNFGGQSRFEFELPASATSQHLVIQQVNTGGVAPVLYDLTNGLRITTQLISATQIRVVLPASSGTRKLVLASMASGSIASVDQFVQRRFVNYANANEQGDYIILSNRRLFNDGAGINQVEQYRQYRASAAGGSFRSVVYDVEEIIDQFGWGIKNNAYAIKQFVRFAHRRFTVRPKFLFIIGKGVLLNSYRAAQSTSTIDQLNLVPVYGNPASDNLLASEEGSVTPLIPVGRLNAVNGTEIKAYLDKVRQYERFYDTRSCDAVDELWKKNILHVGGANDAQGDQIMFHLNQYKQVVTDTLLGADVTTLQKTSVATVQNIATENANRLFNEGFLFLNYFGHSSATALEYNLDNPQAYPSIGKYPIFLVNGCYAGDLFINNTSRLNGDYIISENWVLSPNRGAIAFIASTHYGLVSYLHVLTQEFYNQFSRRDYGGSIGVLLQRTTDTLIKRYSFNDFFVRMHLEQMALHGDPAIRFYGFEKPDYAIAEKDVKISPEFISVAEPDFTARIKIANAGRAIRDSIHVFAERTLPDGSRITVFDRKIKGVLLIDSLDLKIPIDPFKHKGLNRITVSLDPNNKMDEVCETNNIVSKEFFIFEDEIRPVYPYQYSIVNKQNIIFQASTANPLATTRKFYFQIDTTERFNTSVLRADSVVSNGGSISFQPAALIFLDSTVYYWRVGMRPQEGSAIIWNQSSFLYSSGVSTGFAQSHYFQHKRSLFEKIILDTTTRRFQFDSVISKLKVRTGIYPYQSPNIDVSLNFDRIENFGCTYGTFHFYVFDQQTLKPWVNKRMPDGLGRFGSIAPCAFFRDRIFFEYSYYDPGFRKRAIDFIDSIPNGNIVVVTNYGAENIMPYFDASMLKADEASLGSGISLYHKLKSEGFSLVDSFRYNIPMVFMYRKGDPKFNAIQSIGTNSELITQILELPQYYTQGIIESPWFGPSQSWNLLTWNGASLESTSTDRNTVEILGKSQTGNEVRLGHLLNASDTSLSFIDAERYPFLKLKLNSSDEVNATPHQLLDWRIYASFPPEGAIAPNLKFEFKDTLELGEPLQFKIAFKNIGAVSFDSLKLKLIVTDKNNVPQEIALPRTRPLEVGDSVIVSHAIDTRKLQGKNVLYLMVNADNDQPEQSLFNNFIYKDFFVKDDRYQPWLDVTFDGVHILNRDIVSARPDIVIKLKDDSRFLALNDTSLLKLSVRYPDGTSRSFSMGTDTVRFVPADLSRGENTATLYFNPQFTRDGEYELMVSGTDINGNKAGELEYKVAFQVLNKPMISNLLNYPNPFTTSTAFVFTLTGSEVPQHMRIQILTITGKVVREITKQELGPIRIGRNITEFKWDGTDQYGNKLANGIYLYRVITQSNGKSLDKYQAEGDNTDRFFNKGYGKMYLMR